MFGAGDDPMAQRLSGTVDPALAASVHGAWLTFITDGAPTAQGLPSLAPYDLTNRATMLLTSAGSTLAADPAGRERALWAPVFAALAAG